MNHSERWIWLDGAWVRDVDAVIPAETKGLLYGAGCFETFRSYCGRFLHLDLHMDRFNRGLDYLGIAAQNRLEKNQARSLVTELLMKNELLDSDAVIRIQGSLGSGRGYAAAPRPPVHLIMTSDALGPQTDEYRLVTVPTRVVPSQSRPADLKLSNTLHYMKAWQEAEDQGADDALMLTVDGVIAETAIANIFWKSGDTVYTPSKQCDLLPGVLRHVVCSILSGESGDGFTRLETGVFKPDILDQAELVWVTNSVKEIQPVTAVNGKRYPGNDPFYETLFTTFNNYKKEHLT